MYLKLSYHSSSPQSHPSFNCFSFKALWNNKDFYQKNKELGWEKKNPIKMRSTLGIKKSTLVINRAWNSLFSSRLVVKWVLTLILILFSFCCHHFKFCAINGLSWKDCYFQNYSSLPPTHFLLELIIKI